MRMIQYSPMARRLLDGPLSRTMTAAELLRRFAEAQHLLARRKIDELAVLDHVGEVLAALQHGDVGQRIAVEHDEVGEFAGRELADLAFQTDRVGIVVRRRLDRLERRITA